jgi:putative peptide modification system cyclase
VLPSLDSVSKQLRGKLGEALAMVSKESQPLDKVATSNLDALRAYSLGMRAYTAGDLKSAEALFQQALQVDPNFALAHIGLANVYTGTDQPKQALQQIRSAEALRDRLSARDALYIDAWDATYTAPRLASEKWKLLTTVYPDYFTGQGTSAYFLWKSANRFQEAIPHLLQSASAKNPHRAVSEYLLGALYVEAEHYQDALRYFGQSTADGVHFQNAYYAGAYAAQRKFSEADAVLARGKSSDIASFDIGVSTTRVAMALDQGAWTRAMQLANATEAQAASMGPRFKARYEMVNASLRAMDATPVSVQSETLSKILDDEKGARSTSDATMNAESNFHIAFASYLAAHAGNIQLAKQALSMIGTNDGDSDTAVLSNLRNVAKAEMERASGHPRNAIEILKPLLTGSELYITHVVLMDANADAHDYTAALTEAHWLSSHRGRAYLEFNIEQMLAPFNVAQSDLALLRAAEFYAELHSRTASHQELSAFERVWPNGVKLPWLASRIQKLQTAAP